MKKVLCLCLVFLFCFMAVGYAADEAATTDAGAAIGNTAAEAGDETSTTPTDVAADLFQVGDRAAALGNRKEAPGGPGLLAVVLEARVRREIPVVAEVHLQKPTLIQAEASGKAVAEEKVNLPRAYPEMKGFPIVDLSRAGITG